MDPRPSKQELAAVKRLIKTRTPERYAEAVWDAKHEDATPFAATIGPVFDLAKLPATARLLASMLHDQAIAASTRRTISTASSRSPPKCRHPTASGPAISPIASRIAGPVARIQADTRPSDTRWLWS